MHKVKKLSRKSALIAVLSLGLAGCAQVAKEQLSPGALPPVVNPITEINQTLRDLPPPKQKVPVAVYSYGDQTGQFKPSETTQTLSKAVTQGATSILIKALQDVGEGNWFTVVERERISNLLKERKIITQMRMTYLGEKGVNPKALPPLLFAAIIFEGGIIGYDSNLQTGGIGARLLGIGGDVKYRLDTITVYLRAVSTKTGQVLASVTTHKTIASVGLQGGVFKFIAVDKILEAEAGFTKNEPDQLAVQQAIEKAVYSMVIEGAEKDIWSFSDQAAEAELVDAHKTGRKSFRQNTAHRISSEEEAKPTDQGASKMIASAAKSGPNVAAVDLPEKAPAKANDAIELAGDGAEKPTRDSLNSDPPATGLKKPWETSFTEPSRKPQTSSMYFYKSVRVTPPTPLSRPWPTEISAIQEKFEHSVSRQ